jgi:hypothetical protein
MNWFKNKPKSQPVLPSPEPEYEPDFVDTKEGLEAISVWNRLRKDPSVYLMYWAFSESRLVHRESDTTLASIGYIASAMAEHRSYYIKIEPSGIQHRISEEAFYELKDAPRREHQEQVRLRQAAIIKEILEKEPSGQ